MDMNYSQAFLSIRQTFEDIQLANHKLEETLAQQKPYLLETFLSQLLNGVFSTEEDAVAVAGSIDAAPPANPCASCCFILPSQDWPAIRWSPSLPQTARR